MRAFGGLYGYLEGGGGDGCRCWMGNNTVADDKLFHKFGVFMSILFDVPNYRVKLLLDAKKERIYTDAL